MKIPAFRIGELTRRLGAQTTGAEPLQLAEVLSPVIVAGDLCELVPPILSPRAFAGGHPAVGANFAAAQFRCMAPGGAWVQLYATNIGAFAPAIQVVLRVPAALTVSLAGVVSNMGPQPVVSTVETGGVVAASLGSDAAALFIGDFGQHFGPVFVPPGNALYSENVIAAQVVYWCFIWQEFAAPRAAES